jgi:hypothetical protein
MTWRLAALIVLTLGAGTAAGAELGRMFFTPAQRAALDNFRRLNIRNAVVSDDDRDKDLVTPPPAPERMKVNGVVRRSDGKSTVWINRRAVSERQAHGVNVSTGKNNDRVMLTVPQSGRSIELKVGQTVEVVSGTIEEGYARRALPLPEANAAPGAEDIAPGVAKAMPPAASQPVTSAIAAGKGPTRTGERDAQDDLRPDSVPESKEK